MFLLMSLSFFGIGRSFARRISCPDDAGVQLALGTGLTAALHAGLTAFWMPPRPLMLLIIACWSLGGCVLGLRSLIAPPRRTSRLTQLFVGACGLYLLLKWIEGTQLHAHGDAYVAYLRGPRSAILEGSWEALRRSPILFLSSSWESLASWPLALLGWDHPSI